ncbi:MFS transporter [Mumia zhuanghuii]|uniref:MFS transporter n=1 Tax=Mumia zhuanghuii TaxID=2585211 RepID=A0A5C4MT23_9ACTN|nr:MFS transporter [Mumia zhuanghuii]TNC31454.1 MFS transporter [Mumia zhuanghuii]TNC47788.1 MFS transporter [Mumia zhuanghuii]
MSDTPISRRQWLAMLTLSLGVSLVVMDMTIVNVAVPVIIDDLGLTAAGAQWMNAIYLLMLASLLLAAGRLGDRIGRRKVYAIGLILFMVASLSAGAAQNQEMLIAARFVQGLGAAMIVPASLSTLNATFQGRARGIAFAIWGSTVGGMVAVGPLVGGWLATESTWRWAFWINIPFGLLALVGIAKVLDETRDDDIRPGTDVTGILLSTLGLGGLVFGLIEGQYYGWWRQDSGALSPVPFSLALGALLLVAFVVVEARRARAGAVTLVDLTLMRFRSLRYGSIAATIVALGEIGLIFTLPLLLQGALGYTPLGTGVLILWLAVGTFLASGATPPLTQRLGQRAVIRIGLVLEVVAIAGTALIISEDVSGPAIAGMLFVYGVGVGMATAQLTSAILIDVPVGASGQASGFLTTVRQLGSALGIAVLGGLLISSLASQTADELAKTDVPASQQDEAVAIVRDSAGAAIPELLKDPATAEVGEAAQASLITASKITTGIAAIILLGGLAATLALPAAPVRPAGAAPAPAPPASRPAEPTAGTSRRPRPE